MIKIFITFLKKHFYEALQLKTSWGRNEIKEIFEEAITNALVEFIDELEKLNKKIFKEVKK